ALVLAAELLRALAGPVADRRLRLSALASDARRGAHGAVSADDGALHARLRGSRDQPLAELGAARDPLLGGPGRAREPGVHADRRRARAPRRALLHGVLVLRLPRQGDAAAPVLNAPPRYPRLRSF